MHSVHNRNPVQGVQQTIVQHLHVLVSAANDTVAATMPSYSYVACM